MKNQKQPESQEGHIRISNREKIRYQTHRNGLVTLLGIGAMILFALVLLLMMKNYTDQRIIAVNNLLNQESPEYNELEKRIYERGTFRSAFDLFAPNLVGIAYTPGVFSENNSDALSTGVVFGENGMILAPAAVLRGREQVYIRTTQGQKELILEAHVLGVDKASGLGLLEVPALEQANAVEIKENKLVLAQTILLIGMPKGDPDTGNLTMGLVHAGEELYGVKTYGVETKLSAFLTTLPVYFGNDGGAVVTTDGKLAGIVSSELTQRLGVSPFTAVVPTPELQKIVDRIQNREGAISPSFGLEGDMTWIPALNQVGFYVLGVEDGSTAQRGGIQPTDIILTVDGQAVTKNQTIDAYLKGKISGDNVTLTLSRLNKILFFDVKIY